MRRACALMEKIETYFYNCFSEENLLENINYL